MKKIQGLLLGILMLLVLSACTTSQKSISQSSGGGDREKVKVTSVIDGDTMKIDYKGKERKVRFLLIDAPEMHHKVLGEQPFGKEAQTRARQLLQKGQEVSIEFDKTGDREDKYGRLLAYVYADGKSVQEQLISEGLVRVGYVYNKQASHLAEYNEAEKKAKSNKYGIWQYEGYSTNRGFDSSKVPNWSPGKPMNTTKNVTNNVKEKGKNEQKCTIKGNINSKGNRIYHMPGQKDYENTKEEKLFCSKEEAEADGFIAAKQ